MRGVASDHGTGVRGTGRAASQGRGRVIISREYHSGIDAEPNITVAGVFPSG